MNIGIDIDDTITETSEFLVPYVSEYYGIDMDYLKKHNISYGNLPKEYQKKEKEFGKATFGKVLLDVPIKSGAKEYISKLKNDGNKIVIITARDETIYDNAYEFTAKQLKKFGIEYDKLICSFDKRQVCIDEKIDILIDDSINNLEKVGNCVEHSFLFNSKFNLESNISFNRVDTWEQLYQIIKELG